jgi:hypothetical protein
MIDIKCYLGPGLNGQQHQKRDSMVGMDQAEHSIHQIII